MRLSAAGTHPDLHWLRIARGQEIDRRRPGARSVRAAVDDQHAPRLPRRGHRAGRKDDAPAAQNALLKTLEEPWPRTLLDPGDGAALGAAADVAQSLPAHRDRATRPRAGACDGSRATPGQCTRHERLLAVAGGAPLKALALAPHFAELEEQMTGLLEALLDRPDRRDARRRGHAGRGARRAAWTGSKRGWRRWSSAATGRTDEKPLTLRGGSLLQRAAAELNITAAFQVLDRLREARRLLEGSACRAPGGRNRAARIASRGSAR